MLFPLGLGQRLRQPPVATISLAALTVVCYFFVQQDLNTTARHTAKLKQKHKLKENAVQLFEDFCLSRHGNKKLCREFTPLVGTLYPEAYIEPISKNLKTPTLKREYKLTEIYQAEQKEYRRAQKLNRRFRKIKSDDARYPYFTTVREFVEDRYRLSESFGKLSSVAGYQNSLQRYSRDLSSVHAKASWLSKLNDSPKAVLASQFQHGSMLHLLLNMFNLIVFGIYVEQRIGAAAFCLFYLTGGSLAMFAQIQLMDNPATILLGASGNVSVIAGMFFVFFFAFSLRIFLPLIVTYEKFYAPTKLTLPLLLIVSDLSGAFGTRSDLLPRENVAHVTHLMGFGWGALWALVIAKTQKVPWPFMYPNEMGDFLFLKKINELSRKLIIGRHMLRYNFENVAVKDHVIQSVLQDPHFQRPEVYYERNGATEFLYRHLQGVVAVYLEKRDYVAVRTLLQSAHKHMPLHLYLGRLGQINTLKLGDSFLADGKFWLAMQVYDSFLTRYGSTRQAQLVAQTAAGVVAKIAARPGGTKELEDYKKAARHSALGQIIDEQIATTAQPPASPLVDLWGGSS